MKQFDFGQNWKNYSAHALTAAKVAIARKAFHELLSRIDLSGTTFLDIGFGQGLPLLIATEAGCRSVGVDINPKCGQALELSRSFFPGLAGRKIPLVIGSILDDKKVEEIRRCAADGSGVFQIVYSWGVLHHTGNMKQSVATAAALTAPGGHLVLALYNRHWTSPFWKAVKWLSAHSPALISQLLPFLFYPVNWLGAYLTMGENPAAGQTRGMDFFYDVVDWIGGYPYECASPAEVTAMMQGHGFTCVEMRPTKGWTGCNEFVFRRNP